MKKHILVGILICTWFTIYSQQFPQVSTDSLFSELDKNEIKTGLLYNKVYPFSHIEKYNGVYDTVTNIANWKQMYSELQRSAVTSNGMPTCRLVGIPSHWLKP